ncbi:MAG: hypothetical protein CMK71_11020 [Pseudomonadaceae bacterium]|nr:hypothetical protein [Pseudomonadaceae bacterium]
MNSRFVLTGGPGAGKTSVLHALQQRELAVAPESARQIIQTRLSQNLPPRPDPKTFAQDVLRADIEQYHKLWIEDEPTFYDRGVLDALYMLNVIGALSHLDKARKVVAHPYNGVVFLFEPWPEIYATDTERDQTFEESVQVFEGLKQWYTLWGYTPVEVPKVNIEERSDFILDVVEDVF